MIRSRDKCGKTVSEILTGTNEALCDNNEMEMFVAQREWVSTYKQVSDYVKMYEYIFPQILKEEDPEYLR